MKRELAKKYPNDIDSYIEEKTAFIIAILKKYQVDEVGLAQIKKANQKPTGGK
ncbi:MAG: hypothetical protein ACLGGX_04765 [Bdellovibrionia bacterium]